MFGGRVKGKNQSTLLTGKKVDEIDVGDGKQLGYKEAKGTN